VPGPFETQLAIEVPDVYRVENLVHKKLNRFRVNECREFFEVDHIQQIQKTFESVCQGPHKGVWKKKGAFKRTNTNTNKLHSPGRHTHKMYEVEAVLDHRMHLGELQYLIQWVGYEQPTWEPHKNLKQVELVQQYQMN